MLDIGLVRARFPGRLFEWRDRVESTMPIAARLAATGAPHGTVAGAEEQTAGQGRHGRSWHSEPGSGLYVSVVLQLRGGVGAFPGLTLAVGLAAQEAILQSCGVRCDLRWPNDVMVNEKKCAGILLSLDGTTAVAGIGINVNHTGFPPDIADLATSLRLAVGRELSREALLIELLESIDRYCDLIEHAGMEPVLRLFGQMSSYATGRRVIVDRPGGPVEGVTGGLDEHGFLRLLTGDGKVERIVAGGVRPAAAR
jgi:BirA family transcriptional regulator, biotin operon repressor / biotin---[acetyl-CoA-carboxylase] ligase